MKVGGWGHVLGDKGSGYDIGLQGLQLVIDRYDHEGTWPELGRRFLRALLQNEANDLIDWAQAADKTAIAGLAAEVFAAWNRGDRLAAEVLTAAAQCLARDAAACARKVARRGAKVHFVLTGSILLKQPRFAGMVGGKLRQLWPQAVIEPLRREGVWGAVELARQRLASRVERGKSSAQHPGRRKRLVVCSRRRSPTEQRNPSSMKLDQLSVARAVQLMLREDAQIPPKLQAERERIAKVIRLVARAFRNGGRLFYAGAGTSGRLGVLDASECPPTFGTAPDQVQGIVAGGQSALWLSLEGAEDDAEAGARAMEFRAVTRKDVVIGIAASGTTPFVWGALRAARHRGAATVMICFNPYLVIPRALAPTVLLAPNLGPEILTGSTRLKAGTATKLLLNMITTLSMVRIGKVRSNLMIDLNAANVKLWDRAARIVQELTGADYSAARAALKKSGWVIKKAIARLAAKRSFATPETGPARRKRLGNAPTR